MLVLLFELPNPNRLLRRLPSPVIVLDLSASAGEVMTSHSRFHSVPPMTLTLTHPSILPLVRGLSGSFQEGASA